MIVLAGPSGAGKSRLAERLGLPVLRLDDFYKDGDDPTLPVITDGRERRLADWDDPDSWLPDDALAALDQLCREGRPRCRSTTSPRTAGAAGRRSTSAAHRCSWPRGSSPRTSSPPCGDAGLLAAAYCVRQHPLVTFWRRLTRDLRERRKPPLVLVRRGLALMRDQRRVVADAVAKGCRPVTPDEAYAEITRLADHDRRWLTAGADWAARSGGARAAGPDAPAEPTCLVVGADARSTRSTPSGRPDRGRASTRGRSRCTGRSPSPRGRRTAACSCPGRASSARPPWAAARQMTAITGTPATTTATWCASPGATGVRPDRGSDRRRPPGAGLRRQTAWLPRHVVLAVGVDGAHDGALRFYEPARGTPHRRHPGRVRERDSWISAGWDRPWFVVLPD